MIKTITLIVIDIAPARVWGLTAEARIQRSLRRAGFGVTAGAPAPGAMGPILILRGDRVYDEILIRDLAQASDIALLDDAGRVVGLSLTASDHLSLAQEAVATGDAAGLPPAIGRVDPSGLSRRYNKALRRSGAPAIYDLTRQVPRQIESAMYFAAYKGVTDFVTKYIWPYPALAATRACAHFGITPNQVTLVSLIFVVLACLAFWHGYFGWGLAAAWIMCFLDTVDGKLARVTLNSSRFGDAFDHGIDLLHPPFWYWAWHVGLGASEPCLFWSIVALYLLGRLQEGYFIWRFGIEIHIWQRIDSRFRLITARRNPNLALLTVAAFFGRPDIGFLAVGLWSVASFAFHGWRIFEAEQRRAERPFVSWLAARKGEVA